MIDFGPLLSNPSLFLFGAGAQLGIFAAILLSTILGFDLKDAASIGIIGAADGPTSILVSQVLNSKYIGAIAVAAYSYMALVPIVQPFACLLYTSCYIKKLCSFSSSMSRLLLMDSHGSFAAFCRNVLLQDRMPAA